MILNLIVNAIDATRGVDDGPRDVVVSSGRHSEGVCVAVRDSGVGLASDSVGDALVSALAVVNPSGEVVAEDGSVLAGPWRDGGFVRTIELIKEGIAPPASAREATTLVCVMTDARLDKREAWLVARAGSAGVARAVHPTATAWDGDLVYALATGAADAEPFAISALAADVTAAAIRDAVRQARGVPGCPAAADRSATR